MAVFHFISSLCLLKISARKSQKYDGVCCHSILSDIINKARMYGRSIRYGLYFMSQPFYSFLLLLFLHGKRVNLCPEKFKLKRKSAFVQILVEELYEANLMKIFAHFVRFQASLHVQFTSTLMREKLCCH